MTASACTLTRTAMFTAANSVMATGVRDGLLIAPRRLPESAISKAPLGTAIPHVVTTFLVYSGFLRGNRRVADIPQAYT
jgi:hypothetical protein